MDNVTKDILPKLVEVDNLGEATENPTSYSLLWWLKKILEGLGASGSPVDIKTLGFVSISALEDKEILIYKPVVPEVIKIGSITSTYLGFSGIIRIIHSEKGIEDTHVRVYVLNSQNPTHTEIIPKAIELPLDGIDGYIKIKVESNGVNKEGKAFVALNGYK